MSLCICCADNWSGTSCENPPYLAQTLLSPVSATKRKPVAMRRSYILYFDCYLDTQTSQSAHKWMSVSLNQSIFWLAHFIVTPYPLLMHWNTIVFQSLGRNFKASISSSNMPPMERAALSLMLRHCVLCKEMFFLSILWLSISKWTEIQGYHTVITSLAVRWGHSSSVIVNQLSEDWLSAIVIKCPLVPYCLNISIRVIVFHDPLIFLP